MGFRLLESHRLVLLLIVRIREHQAQISQPQIVVVALDLRKLVLVQELILGDLLLLNNLTPLQALYLLLQPRLPLDELLLVHLVDEEAQQLFHRLFLLILNLQLLLLLLFLRFLALLSLLLFHLNYGSRNTLCL